MVVTLAARWPLVIYAVTVTTWNMDGILNVASPSDSFPALSSLPKHPNGTLMSDILPSPNDFLEDEYSYAMGDQPSAGKDDDDVTGLTTTTKKPRKNRRRKKKKKEPTRESLVTEESPHMEVEKKDEVEEEEDEEEEVEIVTVKPKKKKKKKKKKIVQEVVEEEDEDEEEEENVSTYALELPAKHPPMPTAAPKQMLMTHTGELVPLATRGLSDEEVLLRSLFNDYNPSARPVINSSKTVPVSLQFSLLHIKDLDIRSQVLTTTGLLILEWIDERLTWDLDDHNNLTEIIIEAKGMWKPEFAVINGAEKIYDNYNQFRTVINNRGLIHWEPGGVFKTMCEIDITYYPFDEQHCELQFGAWSYHTSKMNLTNASRTINMDSYKENGEWDVYLTDVVRNEFFYDCCPNERFANIAFVVYMRRRHTFYVLNVILPSIMTSVLLLSVFFCTPGQKVQIGVVVLLSFRIFMLNVSGNIPKTSDHVPLLGIYLTCIMAITTLSMVLTVFVLNLHHISDRPVPTLAKKVVFLYLARMLGMCNVGVNYAKERRRSKSSSAMRGGGNNIYRRASSGMATSDVDAEERTAIIEMQPRNINGTPEAKSRWNSHREVPIPPVKKQAWSGPSEEEIADFTKDWKRMAEVFDRLFFWLFFLAILISTLVLFHPLTMSYRRKPS